MYLLLSSKRRSNARLVDRYPPKPRRCDNYRTHSGSGARLETCWAIRFSHPRRSDIRLGRGFVANHLWYARRLRSMSAREIGWRARRTAAGGIGGLRSRRTDPAAAYTERGWRDALARFRVAEFSRSPELNPGGESLGSSCAPTGCRTGSSRPTMTSSTTAARLGTSSLMDPGPSCPSACVIGPIGHDQGDLV